VQISAALDFRQTGEQTWDIDIETNEGPLKLSAGGGILTIGNEEVPRDPGALESEYQSIYRDFAALIARGESEVDARPLQLVADIFLNAKRVTVEAFEE
jgi:D-galactose 1-dehydrogenase